MAKVTDFGLAQARAAVQAAPRQTHPGQSQIVPGVAQWTLAYRSPEQATGQPLSSKTDLWSWALTLLEMFLGERRWKTGEIVSLGLEGYLTREARRAHVLQIPEPLVEFLRSCFQVAPADRPEGLLAAATSLRAIYEQVLGEPYPRGLPELATSIADDLNNRALSLLDLGDESQAMQFWKEALQGDPRHLETTYNHGLLRWRRGKMTDEELVDEFDQVRNSTGGSQRAGYLLALVNLERGDVNTSQTLLEEASQQVASEPQVQESLDRIRLGEVPNSGWTQSFSGHTAWVTAVKLSEDGSKAVSTRFDGTLRLWDTESGQCQQLLRTHQEVGSGVMSSMTGAGMLAISGLALSADGTRVLVGNIDGLRIWEILTGEGGEPLQGHEGAIRSVCLSAKGSLALSGGIDHTVRLWDVASATCRHILKGHTASVNAVDLSPDRQWAVSASDGRTIRLWKVSSGRCRRILRGHTGPVNAICFSNDGCRLLSGSSDGLVRPWDTTTGKCKRIFRGHAWALLVRGVNAVHLSTNGWCAVSGGADNTVRLWEVDTGRCLRTFHGHRASVNAVYLSANGRKAISGSSDGLAALLTLPPERARYCHFQVSRPKSYAEVMEIQKELERLLRLANEAFDREEYPSALAYLRQARQLPGCQRAMTAVDRWQAMSLVCSRTGLRSAWLRRTFNAYTACFSADGSKGLSVEESGSTCCWNVGDGTRLRSFDEPSGPASSIQWSSDGRWALCCTAGGMVKVLNVASGTCFRTLEGHSG